MTTTHAIPLRHQPFFRLYLLALLISYFGTGLHFVAVSWLVLELTGSASQLGMILGLAVLPSLFVSLPAGILADRVSRKWIAVVADFGRCLVVGMVPLLALTPAAMHHIGLVYAMEICLAILTPFFNVSAASLVRECVAKEDLLSANRAKEIAVQVAGLVGAGVAGLIVERFTAYGALALDALTFLGSSLCFAFVRYHHGAAAVAANRKSVFDSAKDGWTYVRSRPAILGAMALAIVPYVMVKGLNVLLADFVRNGLHGDAKIFGIVDAAYALGAIAGGIAVAALLRRFGNAALTRGSFLLLAAAVAAFSFSSGVVAPVVLYATIGFFVLSLRAVLGTCVQAASEIAMVGRVQGLQYLLQGGITPVALMVTGHMADVIGARGVLLAYAVLAFLGMIGATIRPLPGIATEATVQEKAA